MDAGTIPGNHPVKGCPIRAAAAFLAMPSVLVVAGRNVLERCTPLFDSQDKSSSLWS